MADADVPITAGTGTKIDTRTVGAGTDEHRQVIVVGDPTTAANVSAVSAAGRLSVDASGVAVPVTDNAGSLTVDAPVGTPAFVRLSDGSAAQVGQKTMANSLPVAVASDQSALTVAQATAANLNALVAQGAPAAQANSWFVRPRKLATYSATYKTASRPYNLSSAIGATSRKQYATIYHASSATKTVRLRRVSVQVTALSALTELVIELVRLTATTAPATGNPAITPALSDSSDSAAEATCLALPTTAGSEGAAYTSRYSTYGITAGGGTTNPPPKFETYELVAPSTGDDEQKLPVIRAGVAEGWAVVFDVNIASTVLGRVEILFTEE